MMQLPLTSSKHPSNHPDDHLSSSPHPDLDPDTLNLDPDTLNFTYIHRNLFR